MASLRETYRSEAAARDATEAFSASRVPHHNIRLLIGYPLHDIRYEPVGGFGARWTPTLPSGDSPVFRGRAGGRREAFTAILISSAKGPSRTLSGS